MRLILISFLMVLSLLAGCATAYGPRGLTGGYTETKIDDSTYRVAFFGNGKTTRDMVWNYWIYRCAEVTIQNGYEFFSLQATSENIANAQQSIGETAQLSDHLGDDPPLSQMASHAPVFIYVPGNTITRYSGNGVIKMMHQPGVFNGLPSLRASTIMQMLSTYIKTEGQTLAPSDQEIIKAALAETTSATPIISKGDQRPQSVTMEDLNALLPPR